MNVYLSTLEKNGKIIGIFFKTKKMMPKCSQHSKNNNHRWKLRVNL